LNFKISNSRKTIGNVCGSCCDSQKIYSFGLPKILKFSEGGNVKVTFPEMIARKENANIKILVDEES